MLEGFGGSIGVFVGDGSIFLVDDKYAPLTPKIIAAIRELSDQPIRFVINTHWHDDHAGGIENLGKAGALIIAHDNARVILALERMKAPAGISEKFGEFNPGDSMVGTI